MNQSLKAWLGGLISAFSGAASGAIGAAIADADHFIYAAGAGRRMTILCVCTAAVNVFSYLQKSPLPGVNGSNGVQIPQNKN